MLFAVALRIRLGTSVLFTMHNNHIDYANLTLHFVCIFCCCKIKIIINCFLRILFFLRAERGLKRVYAVPEYDNIPSKVTRKEKVRFLIDYKDPIRPVTIHFSAYLITHCIMQMPSRALLHVLLCDTVM